MWLSLASSFWQVTIPHSDSHYYWLKRFLRQMDSDLTAQCGPHTNKVKCPALPIQCNLVPPRAAVCGRCAVPRCLDRSQSPFMADILSVALTAIYKPRVSPSGTET